MLHIINHFPPSMESLSVAAIGDTVVLQDAAVQAARENSQDMRKIKKQLARINLCVRKLDLSARNIADNEVGNGIAVLDEHDYQAIVSDDVAIRSWN